MTTTASLASCSSGLTDGVAFFSFSVAKHNYQRLRYKDYQLLCRPAPIQALDSPKTIGFAPGLSEVSNMKEFSNIMKQRGILTWWRKAVGFTSSA